MVFLFRDPNDTLSPIGRLDDLISTIKLELRARDKAFDFELHRALFGQALIVIARIRGSLFNSNGVFTFTDFDVVEGTLYEYSGRHVRSDAIDSVLSPRIKALAGPSFSDGGGEGGGGGGGGDDGSDDEIFLRDYSPNFGDAFVL